MYRVLLLVVLFAWGLAGCGGVEWFPEFGVVPFSFSPASVTGVTAGSTQTSNTVVVKMNGMSSASISVSGGEFSVNGGAFTSTAGTINNNATVAVRHTAATGGGQTKVTTLTVGDKSASFSSTTVGFPEDVRFNVTPNTEQISGNLSFALSGASAPISVTGGQYSINGGGFTAAPGTINASDTVRVKHTSADGTTATAVATTLTIGSATATFTTSTGPVLPLTVNASGPVGTVVFGEGVLRAAPGSYTITLDPVAGGTGSISFDTGADKTYSDPPITVTLADSQPVFFSDIAGGTAGSLSATTFRIGGVPLVYRVTATAQ